MRAIPLAAALKEKDVQLFIYNRRHVNTETKMASGYYIIDDEFIPVARPVPKVNGNWYIGNVSCPNRSGMSHYSFIKWAKKNDINVYPEYDFGRRTTDKMRTYELLGDLALNVHPYTERYEHDEAQVERFLNRNNKIFLKARKGSQGDKIFVLSRSDNNYSVSYYASKDKIDYTYQSIGDVLGKIKEVIGNNKYIIQEGIDTACIDGNPFIIRVIMIHDGWGWHWAHKIVACPVGDVANTEQGGLNHTVEDFFPKVFGKDSYSTMYKKLKTVSFSLANHFDALYPKQLIEFAIDFVASKSGDFYVVEADVTPGLIKPGMDVEVPFKDYFNISPEEKPLYDKYLVPHARYMAEFLLTKL